MPLPLNADLGVAASFLAGMAYNVCLLSPARCAGCCCLLGLYHLVAALRILSTSYLLAFSLPFYRCGQAEPLLLLPTNSRYYAIVRRLLPIERCLASPRCLARV